MIPTSVGRAIAIYSEVSIKIPLGRLLLVTVDGRQPGWSVGASFEESARIMRALGATDTVNLDGGGSTTITINQQLINRPSDSTGERPIADAIEIQSGIQDE
jgi:exopolysaccharide biosynthesis protein